MLQFRYVGAGVRVRGEFHQTKNNKFNHMAMSKGVSKTFFKCGNTFVADTTCLYGQYSNLSCTPEVTQLQFVSHRIHRSRDIGCSSVESGSYLRFTTKTFNRFFNRIKTLSNNCKWSIPMLPACEVRAEALFNYFWEWVGHSHFSSQYFCGGSPDLGLNFVYRMDTGQTAPKACHLKTEGGIFSLFKYWHKADSCWWWCGG